MRRNWRESLPVMEFHHPPKFSLNSCKPFPESQDRPHRFSPFRSWVLSLDLGILVGLGFSTGFPRCIINQLRPLALERLSLLSGILSFLEPTFSPTVGEEDEVDEDEEEE